MTKVATAGDFRAVARRRLPHMLFEYLDGGSYDEVTLKANVADLRAVRLRQRVLRDVGTIDTSTTLFGQRLDMPLVLGPVGFAGLFARRGEAQAARAAVSAGIPFCLSTVGICPVEEVAVASAMPPWYQLYMIRDRAFMDALLDRVEAAGVQTLLFTVDLPVGGARYRDVRSGMNRPGGAGWIGRMAQIAARPRWALDVGLAGRPLRFANLDGAVAGASTIDSMLPWIVGNMDPTVSWPDLERIRARWRGPLVLKGILDPDDAEAALGCGVDAIIVSNHGGRQLDGALSTITALPAIARRIAGRVPLLADGGIRSGIDILRFLASGADACLIGRTWAWALAAGGEAAVVSMLATMKAELRTAMALTGCLDIASARSALVSN
ncbi:MAG: L-lactate dehydrogenase [Sphingomonadaceae bacterium]